MSKLKNLMICPSKKNEWFDQNDLGDCGCVFSYLQRCCEANPVQITYQEEGFFSKTFLYTALYFYLDSSSWNTFENYSEL